MKQELASVLDIPRETVVRLVRIDVSDEEAEPLLERGILPGCKLSRVRQSPSGDPILSVGGTLIAVRREYARHDSWSGPPDTSLRRFYAYGITGTLPRRRA